MSLALAVFACGCGNRPAQAKGDDAAVGPVAFPDADKAFADGKYDEALARYDAAQKSAKSDDVYTRALFRATECETLLNQHEHALDRVRAARVPANVSLAALVELLKLEMFSGVESWYGFPEETEGGAEGSAKLSRAQVDREIEAALAALWGARERLARVPIDRFKDYLVLKNFEGERFPSLWDFVVLRLGALERAHAGAERPIEPVEWTAETFSRELVKEPLAARLGALYEDASRLDGGPVGRATASERWRVLRAMVPHALAGARTAEQRKAYLAALAARLEAWAGSFRTVGGRAEAGATAAEIEVERDEPERALDACERVLKEAPADGAEALRCRQTRQRVLDRTLDVSAHVTRLPARSALHLRARNLATVYLRLYKIDPEREADGHFWSEKLTRPSEPQVRAWLARKPLREWSVKLPDRGDHRFLELDADAPVAANGLYAIVASGDAHLHQGQDVMSAAFLDVTDLAIVRADTDAAARFYVFDAATSGPAPGADVAVLWSHDWRVRQSAAAQSGADGVAVWSFPIAGAMQLDALAMRGDSLALFPNVGYHNPRNHEAPLVLYLQTDRPIYRPGQDVKVRVTSIARAGDGNFKVDAGRKLRLELRDANGKTAASKELTAGAMGSAAATFAIPAKALLGQYQLIVTAPGLPDVSSSLGVAVEEYKRPEFEITLDAPKDAQRYGRKAEVPGTIKYYFGGAAPDVTVKYVVSRRKWTPWWSWYRSSGKKEILRSEAKSDASGAFKIAFTPERDPTEPHIDDPDVPDVSDFEIEVEAHDAGGRTISAQSSVRVGAQSLLLSAQGANGFFFSDEKPAIDARLTNLAEVAVAGAATWQVRKLGEPAARPDAGLELARALRTYPLGAVAARGEVKFIAGKPSPLALPALEAGGYRLELETKDPWGATVKGACSFLVADAKTRAVPLALPPLAIARTTTAEPRAKVQFLVGSGWASGNYHLEVWTWRKLVWHALAAGAKVRVVEVDAPQANGFTLRWLGTLGLDVQGADAGVTLERKDKKLAVTFAPRAASLEPGQKAEWGIEVKDARGKPVAGEALVAIYDRSLELYARGAGAWADGLYQPPPAPDERTDGFAHGYGSWMPLDTALQQRRGKEVQGAYRARGLPRFSFEPTRRFFGDGDFQFARGVMTGEAAPTTAAQPMGGEGLLRLAVNRRGFGNREEAESFNGFQDEDGRPDDATGLRVDLPKHHNGGSAPAPAPRTNMAESALFLPDLRVGENGAGRYSFTAPERLTSWRVQVFALGRAVEAGRAEDTFVTRKELMVRVELPRFVREGDRATVTAVVHNETAQAAQAKVELAIVGPDGKSALAKLGVTDSAKTVNVAAHGLQAVDFALAAPDGIATYKVRAQAVAGKKADAEERELPVLPSRERLIQSQVVALNGNDHKTLRFDELLQSKDPSLRNESMVISIEPQLALSILRSIPYLIEYPYECTEQTVNRFVPLAIVNEIYKKHPELARAIAALPHRKTENEPWRSDDPRRLLELTETPWLRQSEGGSDDARLRGLLDPKLVASMQSDALDKLTRAQRPDGSFPWFPGGEGNFYMTLYLLDGFSLLREFGIEPPNALVTRALDYVIGELPRHMKAEESDVAYLAYGAYVLTSFDGKYFTRVGSALPEIKKWCKWILENKQTLTPFGRAYMARVEARLGDRATAMQLLESALDGSKSDPLIGVYWTPERYSWMWYSDSVEKHAFFLRTLAELEPDDARIAGMAQWLLFNRKGNQWHSTKASAAAVYSLLELMEKSGALKTPEQFHLKWGAIESEIAIKPDDSRQEPLTYRIAGAELKPQNGEARIDKQGPGVAFASGTWIYSSTKLQDAHPSTLVSVERKYFKRVHRGGETILEPLHSGDKVKVGDDIEVRLYIKAGSQFEYVHVKEPRGAGFEETTLRSGYHWEKLSFYEEPRDSLTNFFVDWLPHGELELRHSLRPATPGKYRISSAVVQSMYSPDITAYSAGMELEVER
ncbi:MAG TPA: alpha-2-macroglobulin family protein [Polyangia bacterium]|nr:alpha-2-macroglobulin family protein [Polyangia bacterium]